MNGKGRLTRYRAFNTKTEVKRNFARNNKVSWRLKNQRYCPSFRFLPFCWYQLQGTTRLQELTVQYGPPRPNRRRQSARGDPQVHFPPSNNGRHTCATANDWGVIASARKGVLHRCRTRRVDWVSVRSRYDIDPRPVGSSVSWS